VQTTEIDLVNALSFVHLLNIRMKRGNTDVIYELFLIKIGSQTNILQIA